MTLFSGGVEERDSQKGIWIVSRHLREWNGAVDTLSGDTESPLVG